MTYTQEMRDVLDCLAANPAFRDDGYRLVDVPNVGEEVDSSFGSLFKSVPGTDWREYVDFGLGEVTFSGLYSEVIHDGVPIWYHHCGQMLTPLQLRLVLEAAERLETIIKKLCES